MDQITNYAVSGNYNYLFNLRKKIIFREAVFIAAALNRTIVPPPFFKHSRTDKSDGSLIHPWDRVNLESLAKLSMIVNPQNLSIYCGDHFDVFLNTKRKFFGGTPTARTKMLYSYGGLDYETFPSIKKIETSEQATIYKMNNMMPVDTSSLPVQGSIRLGVNVNKVRDLWKSDGKCSLLLFPYHAIDFKKILHDSKIKLPEVEFMKKIVLATTRPKHVT